MQDIFISIKAYLYERAASPLTGAFAVSWVVWNYRFFVVLFSDGLSTPSSKFAVIDQLFDVDKLPFGEYLWPCIGPLFHGLLMPAAIALFYLFIYPVMAQPVYQYSLVKQRQLTLIKQKQESERRLTAEQSSNILRQMAQVKIQHENEVVDLNDQISKLKNEVVDLNDQISKLKTSHESELAQYHSERSKLKEEINKRDADSHPALPDMDEQAREEALEYYDGIIRAAIEKRHLGYFNLNELFGQSRWSAIANNKREDIEERFRSQVQRGDHVGVSIFPTADGPLLYMKA